MATAESVEATPGTGECEVCFESVNCTKILACGHTFCIGCLSLIAEKAVDDLLVIKCPICREERYSAASVQSLPSRFYGRIKCDKCLQCKKTNDTWWCPMCVQAMCSRCRLTAHSRIRHSVAEWNSLAPAACSLAYVNELRSRRAKSVSCEMNLAALERYLAEVKKALINRLKTDAMSEYLSQELVIRYGALKSVKLDPELSEANEEYYRKALFKVSQLAGIDVSDTQLPSLDDSDGHLCFKISPDEAATILLQSIELTPVRRPSELRSSGGTASVDADDGVSRFSEAVTVVTCTSAPVKLDYFSSGLLAILSGSQLTLFNLKQGTQKQMQASASYEFVDLCFSRKTDELLLVLRSLSKQHDWSLQVVELSSATCAPAFTASFDVGPEDALENMRIVTSSTGILYTVRDCKNVSEIWKVVIVRKRVRVKLREVLVYQKENACYTSFDVLEADKRIYLIAWDNINRCLSRLIIRDNHCISVWKILVSPDPVPFCLGATNFLWLFDPVLNFLYNSSGPVMNSSAISLQKVLKYDSLPPNYVWNTEDKLLAAHCDNNVIRLVQFDKSRLQTNV